jgi:ABC-2 type transport system ATP-binding protein
VQQAGFRGAALFGTKLHVFWRDPVRDRASACRALEESGVRVMSVSERPLSLEDVFIYHVMELEQAEQPAGRHVVTA